MFSPDASVSCATIGPGRVALYSMPVHWLTNGRSYSTGRRSLNAPQSNPIEAARRAKRNAMDAAGWLYLRSRGHYVRPGPGAPIYFRQGFWTLTLPEPAAEKVARAALSAWLTWARNVAGLGSYLWTAELTDRGRVHFHLILNTWIPHGPALAAWRRALMNAGALPADFSALDPRAIHVERCKGAREGQLYAAKYVGKAFGGNRAEQLGRRLDRELAEFRPDPDRIAEIRSRLGEAMAASRAGIRRWSASQDVTRPGATVNAAEHGATLDAVSGELQNLGAYFTPANEHGTVAYFDLGKLNTQAAPTLTRILRAQAGIT